MLHDYLLPSISQQGSALFAHLPGLAPQELLPDNPTTFFMTRSTPRCCSRSTARGARRGWTPTRTAVIDRGVEWAERGAISPLRRPQELAGQENTAVSQGGRRARAADSLAENGRPARLRVGDRLAMSNPAFVGLVARASRNG